MRLLPALALLLLPSKKKTRDIISVPIPKDFQSVSLHKVTNSKHSHMHKGGWVKFEENMKDAKREEKGMKKKKGRK